MIRKGIYNIDQLLRGKLSDFFGKEKNISIKIYNDITDLAENDLYEKYSEIVLNRFNTNGNAIKRTYRNRFNDFDGLAIETIKSQKNSSVQIHDIAISDGRASCYFLENVISNFQDVKYTASDIAVSYNVYISDKSSGAYIITDKKGSIIEITKPPFVWNLARDEGSFYFLNNWLKKKYKTLFEAVIKSDSLGEPLEIALVDREFKKLLSQSNSFSITNYNLFEPSDSKYNVIRLMNILHYGYFNEVQIKTILSNIFNALEPGGVFIEGSNEDAGSEVMGAIYGRTANGFELLSSGPLRSRILDAVLSFKITS